MLHRHFCPFLALLSGNLSKSFAFEYVESGNVLSSSNDTLQASESLTLILCQFVHVMGARMFVDTYAPAALWF